MSRICPTCGQRIQPRNGISLTPMKDRLFGLIEKRDGIAINSLATALYPDVPVNRARERIKTQVCQINSLMVATGVKITNVDGLYVVEKES